MSEQEINLDAGPAGSSGSGPSGSPSFSEKKIDLSQFAQKATTPEELIDLIINKSPEELLTWEKVILPSKGYYYDGRIPDGEVLVRPMGLQTDKILATSRLTQTGQAIDYVFKHCVKMPDKDFDPLDLLAGDRMFLLFYLRGITHGNNYEFSVTCANETCKVLGTHEYDLNKLATTIRVPKNRQEPIKISLPYFSDITGRDIWVEARFARGRDVQVMMRQQKMKERMKVSEARNAKTGTPMGSNDISLDTTIEENLNLLITSVNGVRNPLKITEIIKRLHGRDSAVIREELKNNSPGIDAEIIITCQSCSQEMRIELPITESFFRPTQPRGAGV